MNEQEREGLLIRIDERTKNIYHELSEKDGSIEKKIDEIIDHQKKQNGSIEKCLIDNS